MHLKWDYDKRTVEVSIPGYIDKLLEQVPVKKHNSTPSIYTPPKFGNILSQQNFIDEYKPLDKEDIKKIQKIIGSLSYYSRIIDPTILYAVNEIACETSKATENAMKKVDRLLGYLSAYPNNIMKYYKSDMILIHNPQLHY
jgi:hypothetical protein